MSVSQIEAGRAFLRLILDDKAFKDGLDNSLRQLDSFGKSAIRVGAAIGAAGAAITAPFVASLKVFSDVGSALNDMSDRTGVSVEKLSELKYAAAQTGTDLSTVESGLRKMARTLTEAETGSKSANDALNRIGLSVRELIGLEPGEQFAKIARAIAQIQDPTQRAAAAMDIFGKSGTQLLPLIKDLDQFSAAARNLGVVMTTQAAKDADAFGDSLDTLKAQLGAVAAAIGGAVAPALTAVAESIAPVLRYTIEFLKANESLTRVVGILGLALGGLGSAIVGIGTAAKGAEAALIALRATMTFIAKHPWLIAITVALTALTALLSPLIDKWLGLTNATQQSSVATAEQTESQQKLTKSMAEGTKEIDARAEALKRLHAEEDKRKQERAIQEEVNRQLEREVFSGQRGAFPGARGQRLFLLEQRGSLASAQSALADIEERVKGAARLKNGQLVNVSLESELLAARKRVADIQSKITSLESQLRPGLLLSQRSGDRASLGLIQGLQFAIAVQAEVLRREGTPGVGARRGGALRGFSSVEQKTLDDFEKEVRPLLSTFNGRLAGQVFGPGAASNPVVQKLEAVIRIADSQRKTLEDIDRNTKKANDFTAGNV